MASDTPTLPIRSSNRRRTLALAGGTMLLVTALAASAVLTGGGFAPGVSVAGVAMDRSRDDAERALRERGREVAETLVSVRADGRVIDALRLSDFGAEPLIEPAIAAAEDRTPGVLSRAMRTITLQGSLSLPLGLRYNQDRLDSWITGVAAGIDRDPVDAELAARGATFQVTAARDGLEVQQDALRRLLTEDVAAIGEVVVVPVRRVAPKVSTQDATAAAEAGEQILSKSAEVVVRGQQRTLPVAAIATALRADGGRARLDADALSPQLSKLFGKLESRPRSATFRTDGKRARIIPSRPGLKVDAVAVARGLEGDVRPVAADLVATPPDFTTKEAQDFGITEKIGGYTSPFKFGEPRVTNVTLGAKALDGTIIPPNGTISLNTIIGQRTAERGFVPAPMITGSLEVNAIGGGVSQIATTLYTAALNAGLEIQDRTPHSLYIARYEPGLDATISWPEPDLVIRNDWPVAALIRAAAYETSITVNIYSSSLGRRVEVERSSNFDQKEPPTRRFEFKDLKPDETERELQKGDLGFSVKTTRRIFQNGELLRTSEFLTVYRPHPTIIGVPPGTPDAEKFPEPPPA